MLDSNECQTLMAHMSTLKEQESTTQTDRFNEAMKLTFGSAKDALNFGEYLGISSEYERLIVNEGEETMRKEMELLSQQGRQDGDPQWWFSSENEIMKRKFFVYCPNVFSFVYRAIPSIDICSYFSLYYFVIAAIFSFSVSCFFMLFFFFFFVLYRLEIRRTRHVL